MSWWNFKKDIKEPQVEIKTAVQPVVIDPSPEQDLEFASYRADAIARDIEQRRAEGRQEHPDKDIMIAEAMGYGYMLIQHGKWTQDKLASLEGRLRDTL